MQRNVLKIVFWTAGRNVQDVTRPVFGFCTFLNRTRISYSAFILTQFWTGFSHSHRSNANIYIMSKSYDSFQTNQNTSCDSEQTNCPFKPTRLAEDLKIPVDCHRIQWAGNSSERDDEQHGKRAFEIWRLQEPPNGGITWSVVFRTLCHHRSFPIRPKLIMLICSLTRSAIEC